MNNRALFIFRRDLRLEDNTGLISASKDSKIVIPAFIFDPMQADKKKNLYFSNNAFEFLVESLDNLDSELRKKKGQLYLFEGIAHEVVEKLIKKEDIDTVYVNKDYTPFSKLRDKQIEDVCKKNNVKFHSLSDALLNEPERTLKSDGKPYTIFTPYWNNVSKIPVRNPTKNSYSNYYTGNIPIQTSLTKYSNNKNLLRIHGGRVDGLKVLKKISQLEKYSDERDYPALDKTSKLSAHLKFGTVSIREAYQVVASTLNENHHLLRQFYWRDFFYHIAHNFPKVFGNAFQDKYDKVNWDNDNKLFDAWKNGLTGVPIVDAGMRELNATGYMHNRVRMIVASFLTKDLHIDWRLGEKYFAQKLVDYDPCINNGNWQWAASTGCDAQPYFRIFNPWRQQQRFDTECKYIKKWISELKDVEPNIIHNLENNTLKNYPKPIINHSIESKNAILRYKNI